MPSRKKKVVILFGGKSAEHEVSLQSAKSVYEAIDKEKYDVTLVGIDKEGRWRLNPVDTKALLASNNPRLLKLNKAADEITIAPGGGEKKLINLKTNESIGPVHVVFPVLHGPFGEDGTVQGLLKLAGVPFVGASVLGSAVGMDKDVQKRLLREAGIPVAKFITIMRNARNNYANNAKFYGEIVSELGSPFFVKPANLGSSIGVHKVWNKKQFEKALEDAFLYDTKVLAEEYIPGREIECSVLGNEDPIASVPGEVIPKHEFYSYEAKYIDENGAVLEIPAKLGEGVAHAVQEMAKRTFKVLCSEGMARVDFFLRKDGKLFLNEINTIPGFTKISMYPKLWEASGISCTELIDRLIELAIERYEREKGLKTTYT